MIFDFTPDPKVLIALTHTPMQPMDALCELIDNSIDSFHSAKIQGMPIENPMIIINLPTPKQLSINAGLVRIQDNGPGMTADNAEKAIKAGFSGNNPYDTLGLFGMGFNISTGKIGNQTVFMTSRADMAQYIRVCINLEKINETKNYSLNAEEHEKSSSVPYSEGSHGTIIEISDWWPEGNANRGFIQKLVQYGLPKIREEIGRRYATILRKGEIHIIVNDKKCEPFEHCVWDDSRYVTKKGQKVPAVIRFDHVVGNTKRCAKCTAILKSDENSCPSCGSMSIRTIEERITGWVGIQRFDSDTDYGIDLIRNGRAIKVAEQNAFFTFVDDLKHTIKDYPIDSQYGRIVGEISLDFVPVDFLKQDFQRSSSEWQKAMSYIRGDSSLQPTQPGASDNHSPVFRLYQAYRRVRAFGIGDMYMGYWDADSRTAKRISRDTEREYYKKFKERIPGYYDDAEWWKLVESADHPPVDDLPTCPSCGAQHLKEDEICVCCGNVLIGKECINNNCRQYIPKSASTCPICGANQIPVVVEPWICNICRKKNVAHFTVCSKCGNPRGMKNPLSPEVLADESTKVDELSSDNVIVPLADGSMSNPLKIQVYATAKPMINPANNEIIPVVISKSIGVIQAYVDFSHPIFGKYGVSKEQLIANEIALYLYQEKMTLASNPGHTLSSLAWSVMRTLWGNSIELNSEGILRTAEELLGEIRQRLVDTLGNECGLYFSELTIEQKKQMIDAMISAGVDLSTIGELKENGKYVIYTPYDFILTIFHADPDCFFTGRVWTTSLADGGEELLGAEIVAQAKKKILNQYENALQDVINYQANKYTDAWMLQRVKLSISFLRKELAYDI